MRGAGVVSKGWRVVRTKPQSEQLAASVLRRRSYEVYVPCVWTPRPPQDDILAPLFPGYLFLHCEGERENWPAIDHLPGVAGWVRFDDVVPAVPDEVFDRLISRVDAINDSGGMWTRYQPGQQVRVNSGGVESLAEVLECPKTPQARVHVLLEFMGRMVPAEVPWKDLQPVQENSAVGDQNKSYRRTRGRGRWIRGVGPRTTASV